MDSCPEQSDELAELLTAVSDTGLSSPQARRLAELMRNDAAVKQLYLDFVELHTMLVWQHKEGHGGHAPCEVTNHRSESTGGEWRVESGEPLVAHSALPIPHSSSPSVSPFFIDTTLPSPFPPPRYAFIDSPWFAFLLAGVIVGVGLAIAAVWKMPDHSQIASSQGGTNSLRDDDLETDADEQPSSSDKTDPSPSSLPPLIGQITGMVDCQWADDSTFAFDRAYVPLGRKYAISSGLMEITYDTGAKVILQGPCTYEVESETGGYLSLGKLTARVEKRAEVRGQRSVASNQKSEIKNLHSPLFTIKTPTATVTDLGTEFGVEVGETGVVETCVYQGTVEVAVVCNDGVSEIKRRIGLGEAVRVAAKGAVIEDVAAHTGQFVRHVPRPQVIRDGFDGLRNYLADGTADSVWSGILNADTASRIDTSPTNADGIPAEGQLLMAIRENANAGWAEPHRGRTFKNAPYLYVDVPKGDFDARVQIKSLTEGQFCAAGLMARLDDDNFVSVNREVFSDFHRFHTRSEQAGVDVDAADKEGTDGRCALRLVRMGDTFLASSSLDGGQTWTPLIWGNGSTLVRRPDLTGSLQVGLWCGTFNPIPCTATFDTFSLQMRGNGSVRPKR